MTVGYNLSPQQRKVWALQQKGVARYSIRGTLLIKSILEISRVKQCLQQLVNNHEALRTTYHESAGLSFPLQVIKDRETFTLQLISAAERDQFFHRSIEDTLLHVAIEAREGSESLLHISMHLLAGDSQSLQNLARQFCAQYTGLEDTAALQEISYIQFAEWQNKMIETPEAHAQLFWKKAALAEYAKCILSIGAKTSQEESSNSTKYSITLQKSTVIALRKFAIGNEVAVSDILISILAAQIHRCTDIAQVVCGMVFENRKFEPLKSLVGLVSKTLPIVADFTTAPDLQTLAKQVRDFTSDARGWAEYYSDHYLKEPGLVEKPPTIPVGFEYTDLQEPLAGTPQATNEWVDFESNTDSFHIKLHALNYEAAMQLDFYGDTSRVSQEEMKIIASHYEVLLCNALKQVSEPVAVLPAILADEWEKICKQFNPPPTSMPDKGVVALFIEKVRSQPNAPALICQGDTISYKELDDISTQLAQTLQQNFSVCSGDTVAILMNRSPEAIIAMFGVLKTGASYVPVDTAYPSKRIQYIITDTNAKVILYNHPSSLSHLEIRSSSLLIDKAIREYSSKIDTFQEVLYNPDQVAYLIYTSGSTGKPKGVSITHQSLENYLVWANNYYFANAEGYPFALCTSLAFDLTVTCIFTTLLRGDALHIFPDKEWNELFETIFGPESQVRAVKLTPSQVSVLQHLPVQGSGITCAIVGGEAVLPQHLNMLWVRNPQMRIFNEYGPTEATVGCTVSELKVGTEFITIGRPIANTCIYILDEQQKPKAIGEIGELYIAGKGVALGYLHLPEQTQERFIANPFEPGQRMYRSGDRARWLSDGTLHYLGRKDNQVKLRGYRIEPEEIQETLLRSGYVKQAIVTIKYYENDPETAILVVYVVPNSTLDVTALKRLLSEELPMYMVPTVIIPLDKLPLTAHGKPDIDRLLALDDLKITAHAEYVAPRNDMEQRIQSIWQEVLGGTIGVHDDFFAIGGHSIKALQIIARISNTLQVDIGLAAMLAEPTIEGVAKHINGAGKHRAEPIIPLPLQEYYEVSYAQQRLWVLDKVEVNKIVYNMPGAYILKGDFDFDAFKRAIETIFLRHETLRTTFAMVNGQLKQVIHPFDSMLHTVQKAMIESDDYEDLRALADEEANTPFDLAKGPLFRVRILSTKENTNLMLLTMHHIVSDAWSIGVLVNEVTTLYNAFQQGNKNPLPPLLVQYKDFAAWQNRQINELEVQRKYWLRNLQTLPARTELTVDFVRPQVKSLYGKQLACALDSSLSTAIRELAAALRVSEFTVMLSAVYTLLHRLTGQEDIIVGTSVAGRNHVDLEGQIGFFVNMIPLRGQLKKNQTYEKLVQQVRELTINAFDHQQYPFDRLVQDLNLPREANRTPLFDVVVVMQTADMATPDAALNGMEISNLGSSINRCEFDLLINIIPSETQFILSAHYSAELFEEATVQIMLEKLRLIVESVTSQPATLLQDIPLLVEEEKKIMAKEVSLEFNF